MTATRARGFSLKEAAALTDLPEPAIRKAIEEKTIRPRYVTVGGSPRYCFRGRDLLYLATIRDFPVPLTARDRLDLWDVITHREPVAGQWRLRDRELTATRGGVVLRVDVEPVLTTLVERLRAFRNGRRRVIRDPAILSGEPVFRGTRIPLAHIAGLIRRGVSMVEIREDYPSLSEEDLAYAELVARMKPDPGRPRKALRLIREPTSANGRRASSPPRATAH